VLSLLPGLPVWQVGTGASPRIIGVCVGDTGVTVLLNQGKYLYTVTSAHENFVRYSLSKGLHKRSLWSDGLSR